MQLLSLGSRQVHVRQAGASEMVCWGLGDGVPGSPSRGGAPQQPFLQPVESLHIPPPTIPTQPLRGMWMCVDEGVKEDACMPLHACGCHSILFETESLCWFSATDAKLPGPGALGTSVSAFLFFKGELGFQRLILHAEFYEEFQGLSPGTQ